MIPKFYLLRAVTNLHVGSGETNYGVIDKLIERDATTGFPCINSSGLKGAIKQKFKIIESSQLLMEVFGSDVSRNVKENGEVKTAGKGRLKEDSTQQGQCDFLSARLLAIPVRSDKTPFFLATSPTLLVEFFNLWKDLNDSDHPLANNLSITTNNVLHSTGQFNGADLGQTGRNVVGSLPQELGDNLKALFKTETPVVIIPDELLIEVCDDLNLPVIARNALEDGQSQNLWYEQVLPRMSLMYFPIIWDKQRHEFDLSKGILQIGGNASVGYGFTKISTIV